MKTYKSIKTLDISARTWFDKVNGNTYHSSQITVNFGMKSERTLYTQWQYGYGEMYFYTAMQTLQSEYKFPTEKILNSYELREVYKIIVRTNVIAGKKADMVQHGIDPKKNAHK